MEILGFIGFIVVSFIVMFFVNIYRENKAMTNNLKNKLQSMSPEQQLTWYDKLSITPAAYDREVAKLRKQGKSVPTYEDWAKKLHNHNARIVGIANNKSR